MRRMIAGFDGEDVAAVLRADGSFDVALDVRQGEAAPRHLRNWFGATSMVISCGGWSPKNEGVLVAGAQPNLRTRTSARACAPSHGSTL